MYIDYYVIRADLGALDPNSEQGKLLHDALCVAIKEVGYESKIEKYYIKLIGDRWKLKNVNQHFVNFAGGTYDEMEQLFESITGALVNAEIFGDINQVKKLPITIVDGPLVRKTEGRTWRCHMPLSHTTFSNGVVELWHATEKAEMGENTLRLVTQSGRHGCCFRARALIDKTGVADHIVDELIERHFRWKPDIGKMRKRYAGILDMFQRMMVTILF